MEDFASALSLHLNEASKYVGELEREGRVTMEAHYGAPYYCARSGAQEAERKG